MSETVMLILVLIQFGALAYIYFLITVEMNKLDFMSSTFQEVERKFKKETHDIVAYLNAQGDQRKIIEAYYKLADRVTELERETKKKKVNDTRGN